MSEQEQTLRRLLQEVVGMFPFGLPHDPQHAEFDDLLRRIEATVGNPLLTGMCLGVEKLEPADRQWAEGVWRRWRELGQAVPR